MKTETEQRQPNTQDEVPKYEDDFVKIQKVMKEFHRLQGLRNKYAQSPPGRESYTHTANGQNKAMDLTHKKHARISSMCSSAPTPQDMNENDHTAPDTETQLPAEECTLVYM